MNNIKNIKAKVLRVDEEEHKFVIEVEDRIYKVAQVDFQRRQPAPETLNCLMITTHLGKVFIAQDIEHLMRKNYKENDEVNFKIKMALGNFYHLEDEFGFTAMLKRDTVINAALTPMVKCRILKFHQKYMDVQLVEVLGADKSEFSLSEKEFYDIIGEENWNTQEFRNLMLGDTPSDIFDLECHRWIAGLSDSLNQDELQILLRQIHSRCLETLESENLLPRCKEAERILLEQRFTDVIELLSYYIQAIEILRKGKAEDTISQILSTLSTCAYIYHPRKQFCIMQCIFMLDFSIMEKLIDSILTTIRGQEMYLWNRKPFQMQWIKLLQGYVDNIYNQTDRLTSDIHTKETMIQVLTIELILGSVLGHLGVVVAHVLHGLADPDQLNGHAALCDVVTDVVTEGIGDLGTLLLALEHVGIGRGILHLGRVAAGQAHAVRLGTLLRHGLRTLAALGHKIFAQHIERLVVLLGGLAQSAFPDTLVHSLEIERNILHFVAHAIADVGSERIRQRVELGQTAQLYPALVSSAGGEHCGTRERRSKKDFFHCCFHYV